MSTEDRFYDMLTSKGFSPEIIQLTRIEMSNLPPGGAEAVYLYHLGAAGQSRTGA